MRNVLADGCVKFTVSELSRDAVLRALGDRDPIPEGRDIFFRVESRDSLVWMKLDRAIYDCCKTIGDKADLIVRELKAFERLGTRPISRERSMNSENAHE